MLDKSVTRFPSGYKRSAKAAKALLRELSQPVKIAAISQSCKTSSKPAQSAAIKGKFNRPRRIPEIPASHKEALKALLAQAHKLFLDKSVAAT